MKTEEKRQLREGYKQLLKGIINAVRLTVLILCFVFMWYTYFNQYMDREFQNKGNLLIIGVYIFAIAILYRAFGAYKIGYDRLANIFVAEVLALICADIIIGIQVQLMVANIIYVWKIVEDMLILLAFQIIADLLLTYLGVLLYGRFFPPYHILQINGNYKNQLNKKIQLRKDKYTVEKEISANEDISVLQKEIDQYDAVLLNDISSDIKNDLLKYCFLTSKRIYFTPKISDILVKGAKYINLFDSPLFLCKNMGLSFEQRASKRAMDLLISAIGLILTLPIMLITAVLIKAEDGGDVFFKQERCTIGGKKFQIYKFRSMVMDAEKDGRPHPASEKDDRITKVGRFIRKTRIDELPQLFNILNGDMSFVGPRPERVEHVEKYTEDIPEFVFRLRVKGGLTGYAQVYGKYNTTPYDKLKMDLQYIVDYSLMLDLQIIFETVKIIFRKSSTEGFDKETIEKIQMTGEDE